MSLTENHTIAELLYENGKLSAELEAERFMLELITSLSSTELIDDGINTVLREVGEYTCADRAYVFEINEDYTTTNTYEWCKEGVTPQIDNLKGIPFESMPNWIHLFLQGENILIEELEDIKAEMPQEYGLLKFQNVQTLIAFPISVHERLMGFVGVDNPDMKKSRLIRKLLSLLGYYIGVAVDACKKEWTKLEMASIKSRQKYRRNIEEIFCRAQIGIWSIIKQEGKEPVMEADANMCELLGLTKDTTSEECYRIWRDNIPLEYTEKVDNCVKETLEKGYADVIYPWHHPTRGKIWIRCGGVRPKDYEGIGVCLRGYHQDITKNIEQEMRFRSLKAATSEIYYAIYNINLDTDYMEQISEPNKMYKIANDRGIASEKLMEFCTFQIHEDYQEEMRKFFDLSTLRERLKEKNFVSREYPNNQGIWRRAVFIAQENVSAESVTEVLYVTQIIDDYKQKELAYQQELVKALKEARIANDAKAEFLRKMSHDIRTPINGIMGMLDIEEKNWDAPERLKECQEKMKVTAGNLLQLVNDVLDMNRLETSGLEVEHKPFDIREVLRGCWTDLESQAEKMRLELEKIGVSEIECPHVVGSPMHFRQIFANILSNAVKYNKIYGKITFRVDMVSRTEDDVVYRFSVSDTGIGMSEEFQKHIFEVFTQEDTGARTVYRGTGLGMAISKKLVDALGGTIKIKSKKNVGSTFILVFPFAIDKDYENASVQSEPETPNVEGMHVLLVEDNELNMEIARYLLEEAGIQVTAAKNGQEALDIFEQSGEQEIDLILMDIMMPVMDGLEATRRIRTCTHPRGATVPIIAISANAFADDIQKAKNAGMNEHLAKPFEMEKVLRTISRYHKV